MSVEHCTLLACRRCGRASDDVVIVEDSPGGVFCVPCSSSLGRAVVEPERSVLDWLLMQLRVAASW